MAPLVVLPKQYFLEADWRRRPGSPAERRSPRALHMRTPPLTHAVRTPLRTSHHRDPGVAAANARQRLRLTFFRDRRRRDFPAIASPPRRAISLRLSALRTTARLRPPTAPRTRPASDPRSDPCCLSCRPASSGVISTDHHTLAMLAVPPVFALDNRNAKHIIVSGGRDHVHLCRLSMPAAARRIRAL